MTAFGRSPRFAGVSSPWPSQVAHVDPPLALEIFSANNWRKHDAGEVFATSKALHRECT